MKFCIERFCSPPPWRQFYIWTCRCWAQLSFSFLFFNSWISTSFIFKSCIVILHFCLIPRKGIWNLLILAWFEILGIQFLTFDPSLKTWFLLDFIMIIFDSWLLTDPEKPILLSSGWYDKWQGTNWGRAVPSSGQAQVS